MVYQKAPAEHAFITIEKDLKAGTISGLVLLCGQEEYLIQHYANVLVDRFVDSASRQLDLVILRDKDITAEAIQTNAETFSLLSERRVIWLQDLINSRGKLPKHLEQKRTGMDDLTTYFPEIPEGVLVLITTEKPVTTGDYNKQSDGKKLKKLQTAVKKAGGSVYDFTALDQNQLRGFVSKRFMNAGKTCTPGVLRRILRDTGYGSKYADYDLYTLENDLKKIIAHSGSRQCVTEEDLEGTLTISPENNVFRMLDAISQGRKDQALLYLNTLLEDGDSEFGILMNIVKQVEMMLSAREMLDEGKSGAQIISWLKKEERTQEFRAKNVVGAASRMQTGRLRSMLAAAYRVEEHIKDGLMDPRLALEFFIASA